MGIFPPFGHDAVGSTGEILAAFFILVLYLMSVDSDRICTNERKR